MPEITALICGGRQHRLSQKDALALAYFLGREMVTHVIHGAAPGVDSDAGKVAETIGLRVTPYPADWAVYGKEAGPIRNQKMIDEGMPDLLVAFPGGRGTADMVRKASKARLRIEDWRDG